MTATPEIVTDKLYHCACMKGIKRIYYLFVLLWGLGSHSLPGASLDGNAAFNSLKEFLNTNSAEFEVTYAVLHQSNSTLQKEFDSMAKGLGLTGAHMILDKPIYYKVRVSNDGYSHISADSLDAFSGEASSVAQVRAEGVTSNNLCWNEDHNTVFYDYTKFGEESARLGPAWTRIEYAQATKMLSLCLPVRKGSVSWNGTNFTSACRDLDSINNNQGDEISGSLTFSNGMPYVISYRDHNRRYINRLIYTGLTLNGFILPSQVVLSEEMTNENAYNTFVWSLFAFSFTNYPPGSTAPEAVLQPENRRAVITINPDRVAKLVAVAGKQLKNPLLTKVGSEVSHQQTSTSKHIRAALIVAMLLTTAGLGAVLWRARRIRENLKGPDA